MSNLSELRQRAREYSGSYRIIADGKTTIGGKRVSYIHYTNPNNSTNATYIAYKVGPIERSMTIHDSSLMLENLKSELWERGIA